LQDLKDDAEFNHLQRSVFLMQSHILLVLEGNRPALFRIIYV